MLSSQDYAASHRNSDLSSADKSDGGSVVLTFSWCVAERQFSETLDYEKFVFKSGSGWRGCANLFFPSFAESGGSSFGSMARKRLQRDRLQMCHNGQ